MVFLAACNNVATNPCILYKLAVATNLCTLYGANALNSVGFRILSFSPFGENPSVPPTGKSTKASASHALLRVRNCEETTSFYSSFPLTGEENQRMNVLRHSKGEETTSSGSSLPPYGDK